MGGRIPEESLLAVINLIDDKQHPRIPFDCHRKLEELFVERKPATGGAASLHARAANNIREQLLNMFINDENRRISARELLLEIETWRNEYGRPVEEPRHPRISSNVPWPITTQA